MDLTSSSANLPVSRLGNLGDCKDLLAWKGLDNNPWVRDITQWKHDALLCYSLSFSGDGDQGVVFHKSKCLLRAKKSLAGPAE